MPLEIKNEVINYYASHSRMTDPGSYSYLLEGLPDQLEELCKIVQGLQLHYLEGALYGITIPASRLRSDEARSVKEMLELISKLNNQPLISARPPQQRLVGCCRDFALLLCALLRQQGVPARIRFGFGRYLNAQLFNDHVVCEYWKAEEQRWVLVDAQQDLLHCQLNQLSFDPCDVPYTQFILAGEAWEQSRRGGIDPHCFGYEAELSGLWVVQQSLVHDLAALNKREMLIGDNWGLALCSPGDLPSGEDSALLDHLAALSRAGEAGLPELHKIYEQDERIRVPSSFRCYHLNGECEEDVTI